MVLLSGELVMTNTTLSGNSCIDRGGALFLDSVVATLVNNTITDNLADSDADGNGGVGGLWNGAPAGGTVINNLIAGNFDTPGTADLATSDRTSGRP